MRILLTNANFLPSYGGPAISITRLAETLSQNDIDIGLWAPGGTALSTPLLPGDTRIKRLGGTIREAIAQFGPPDLVHDNGIWLRYHHELTCLALKHKLPRVVSVRGMLEPWAFAHKRWKKCLAWSIYQKRDLMKACYLHATSAQEADNLKRWHLQTPVAMVANGVDIPDGQALAKARATVHPDGQRVALFLGRLYPVKGLPILLDAWSRVRPRGWSLHVVGPDEGGHRDELEGMVARLGLKDCVCFPGEVAPQDRLHAYAGADLFILPSYSESFGMAVAEALAHGLPVLTTKGVPWPHLASKRCGWRVDATADALTAGLEEATACDRTILQEMGGRGREFVAAEFGWRTATHSMIELYRAAVKRYGAIR